MTRDIIHGLAVIMLIVIIALIVRWWVLFNVRLMVKPATYGQCMAENKPHEFCLQYND